jgi:hypothetical protein
MAHTKIRRSLGVRVREWVALDREPPLKLNTRGSVTIYFTLGIVAAGAQQEKEEPRCTHRGFGSLRMRTFHETKYTRQHIYPLFRIEKSSMNVQHQRKLNDKLQNHIEFMARIWRHSKRVQ